jgi:hypothetical protein
MAPLRPLPRQLRAANGNRTVHVDLVDLVLSSRRRRAGCLPRKTVTGEVEEDYDHDDDAPSSSTTSSTSTSFSTRRRALLLKAAAATIPLLSLAPPPRQALASKVPALDGVWSSLTGAPPDLFFPAASFLGEFDAVSTLISAEAPLGEEILPPASLAGLRRAREQDLNQPLRYRTRFIKAPAGNPATPSDAVVFDRAFNTISLLKATSPEAARGARIEWDVDDPNLLTLQFDAEEEEELPANGGNGRGEDFLAPPRRKRTTRRGAVRIRVTKRSEQTVADDRIDTSEFVQTIFLNDGSSGGGSGGGVPRVKGSQVFSKWRWRALDAEEGKAGQQQQQPTVVATQVVSEFLSVEAGGERAYLESAGKPVAVYTYRLALTRV